MAKIIKFPKQPEITEKVEPVSVSSRPSRVKPDFANSAMKVIWVFTVLVWPILKWIISIDCTFQFIRMLYFWNTAGHYAGATFLLHFFILTFLTYFVSIYKPKGI